MVKATIKNGVVLEGSPDDIVEVLTKLASTGHGLDPDLDVSALLRDVLSRRDLSVGQIGLLKALYHAGDEGLNYSELAQILGRTGDELNGVLGAFGKRINRTPGVNHNPGITLGINIAESDGTLQYVLKPELRALLDTADFRWILQS